MLTKSTHGRCEYGIPLTFPLYCTVQIRAHVLCIPRTSGASSVSDTSKQNRMHAGRWTGIPLALFYYFICCCLHLIFFIRARRGLIEHNCKAAMEEPTQYSGAYTASSSITMSVLSLESYFQIIPTCVDIMFDNPGTEPDRRPPLRFTKEKAKYNRRRPTDELATRDRAPRKPVRYLSLTASADPPRYPIRCPSPVKTSKASTVSHRFGPRCNDRIRNMIYSTCIA